MNIVERLIAALMEQQISDITYGGGGQWMFQFGGDARLNSAGSPWRILSAGRVAFRGADHAERFGRPKPVDGVAESRRLLMGRTVEAVAVRRDTGDLSISFDGAAMLELVNIAGGAEGWLLWTRDRFNVAVKANGEVVYWNA